MIVLPILMRHAAVVGVVPALYRSSPGLLSVIVIVQPPIRRTEPPTIEVPILKEGCRPVVASMEINSAIEIPSEKHACPSLTWDSPVRNCGIAGSCAVGWAVSEQGEAV